MATPKQEKLIKLFRENMGKRGGTKTLGKLLLEAGYTKATAKNPYEIFESPVVKSATDEIIKTLEDKRRLALTYITEKKLKPAPARELAYITDIFTKNIQLLGGKPTENYSLAVTQEREAELKELLQKNG